MRKKIGRVEAIIIMKAAKELREREATRQSIIPEQAQTVIEEVVVGLDPPPTNSLVAYIQWLFKRGREAPFY